MAAILTIIIILFIVFKAFQRSEVVGHWNHLVANFEYPPEEFYDQVVTVLTEKKIPEIRTSKTNISEGGLLSHQRVYLEVTKDNYTFHICAAPWGTGFFFSWWVRQSLTDIDQLLILIPYFGSKIVKWRQYESYYKLDTDIAFRTSVHQSVLQAIEQITKEKGIRGLTELERQATFRSDLKGE